MVSHSHTHGDKKSLLHASKACRLGTVLALTIGFFFVELICGYILHSVAVAADAIHMLSDSGALIIAMVSVQISKRKSARNTFGWVRAQEVGAIVNCILLLSLSFTIFVQAVKRLITIEPVDKTKLKLYVMVGIIGLCINVIALIILGGDMAHGHSHKDGGHKHGEDTPSKNRKINKINGDAIKADDDEHLCNTEKINDNSNDHHNHSHNHSNDHVIDIVGNPSNNDALTTPLSSENIKTTTKKKKKQGMDGSQMNIRGAFLHVLNDALGSFIVVLAGLAMQQWPDKAWVNYIDPMASLLMISMIVVFTLPLLRESALVLLQTVPVHIEIDDLKKRLVEQVPGIFAVHEFHVWQLSGSKIIASAHICCYNLGEYMRIAKQVKDFFHREGVHSTTIQPEFIDEEAAQDGVDNQECILECLKNCSANTCCGQPSKDIKQGVLGGDGNNTN